MNRPRIVFINIGWMAEYQGPRKNDRAKGGHGYLKEHDGHESYNFKPHRGKFLGYVPGTFDINITKFVGSKADFVTGMSVVWCAMHPELKRHVIVGWYGNATIFRELQKGGPWKIDGRTVEHQIVADAKDVYIVPRELRTFPGPNGPRIGFGRSVIYYGNKELWMAVPEFIRSKGLNQAGLKSKSKSNNGPGHQMDPEKRKQIEVAAVEHAKAYYREQLQDPNCVKSVEPYNLGWDLEVTLKTDEKLLVEVKGTSLPDVCAEVTVNEYEKMRAPERRNSYVIYVVTEAGTDNQCAHIFRYRGRNAKYGDIWRADDGRVLRFEERMAARLTVKR
jgi:hypothetical protein